MKEILVDNPLVLLFVVAAIGYLIGNVRIAGFSLGVAAVLFTGLLIGAMDARFTIPDVVLQLGLAIYVYSVGLSSGPAFFEMYRKHGLKDFGFIIATLLFTGIITAFLWFLMDLSAANATGIYAGSTTNTAALAGLLDYIDGNFKSAAAKALAEQAVIGYSFSYPMGVLGGMSAIVWVQKALKIDFKEETRKWRSTYPLDEVLSSCSVEVLHENMCEKPLRDIMVDKDWNVNFGRILHEGKLNLINWNTEFKLGDKVILVGSEEDLETAIKTFGRRVKMPHTKDHKSFDTRMIFVSNEMMAGVTIASLNLDERFNAIITRIRRGDVEMLAKADTVLELGDRIRFMARRKDLKKLSELFGDSYHQSSKVNLFSFGLGMGLGLLLGNVPIDLGSDISFKLGYAGGPLIIGLILGGLRRTGRVLWSLPYGANVTLQQIGLILLLASLGIKSGSAMVSSLSIEALWIVLASGIISISTAAATLYLGYKVMKKPFGLLMGMVSNQPAILDFALERGGNRLPMFGYTLIFPIALILKIIIAQMLFILLN